MPWATYSIPPTRRLKTTQSAPRESWWICRAEDFSSKAAEEWRRMRLSKFGQIQLSTSLGEARVDRRRLLPV